MAHVLTFSSSAQVGSDRTSAKQIPDAKLMVSARGSESGKVTNTIYFFTLECERGECNLMTLKFNQCMGGANGFSYPEFFRSSTKEGTLTVNNLGNQLEVSETSTDGVGTTKGNYLFGYSLNHVLQFAGKVTSFSGGWIMTLPYLKEVQTIKFVPFVGSGVYLHLDCNTIMLFGVDTTRSE
jgi:hypothetical protein